MKKILIIVGALFLILSFSACTTNMVSEDRIAKLEEQIAELNKKIEALTFRTMKINHTINAYQFSDVLDPNISQVLEDLGFDDNKILMLDSEEKFSQYQTKLQDMKTQKQLKPSGRIVYPEIDFNISNLIVIAISAENYYSLLTELSDVYIENNKLYVHGCVDYTTSYPLAHDERASYPLISLYPLTNFIYISVPTKNINSSDVVNNLEYTDITSSIFDPYPVVEKPVIYFYPTEDIDLTVKYVNEDRLITTYPKYDNGWNIHVKTDGTILDHNNRSYYALFFDEQSNFECNFETGFYVTKDTAIAFLEEKLAILGYTEREANECIMYWLPILEKNGQSLVYFEQTDERNRECPLELSLEPDSMLRTIIHIKKVDNFTPIAEQTLTSFTRTGFCVVEWGSTTYSD